ncbi:MAG: carbonate dehydratase [Sulfurovum sp.]|nr:MAG: carbonate dehydratase [Sulfurovum sp.]
MNKQHSIDIYKIWLGLAAFMIIIAGVKAAHSIVVLFLLSVFIATASAPAVFWLEKLKIPRIIAFFIVLSTVVIVLFGFGYILSTSVDSFLAKTPQYQAKIIEIIDYMSYLLGKVGIEISESHLENMLDPSNFLGFAGSFLTALTAILSNSFIILLGTTFLLFEISNFKEKLVMIHQNDETENTYFETFGQKINRYLAIKTVISFVTAVIITSGLSILGIDFALLLGLIVFLFNFIPSFGSILAAIPAVLVALVGVDGESVFWVILLYLSVNVLIGNIIEPRIMGKNLGLSVVVVFFSLIFWGWVLGPVGMFLAVPLTMTIKLALDSHSSTESIAILLGTGESKRDFKTISSYSNKNWHSTNEDEIIQILDSNSKDGLDTNEVGKRHQRYGKNILTVKKTKGPLFRFMIQFHQALVYILLAATAVKIYLDDWVAAGVILAVVILNAIIGFVQENKALSALSALSSALVTKSTVLRSGEKKQIDSRDLVPGDIVLLQSGDKVPADIRLLSSRELQIDESALTGESLPVSKLNSILQDDTLLADRSNMLYSSTLVTYGTGLGVVVKTGDSTEIGRISELISSAEVLATPLTQKIAKFSHVLLFAILGLATITFFIGLMHGDSWESLFMSAVALSVAMIPEGLPAVLTITLAIGVSRMAKRNAIIRNLPAVETLGSTTVICSDKTGTLTRNEMTVQHLWAGAENFEVSGIGYAPEGSFTQNKENFELTTKSHLVELLQAGLLCNDAVLKQKGEAWVIEGDPTEGAMLVSAHKANLHESDIFEQMPRLDTIPFESQHQYMATLHEDKRTKEHVVYVKGSVESILQRCDVVLGSNGATTALNHSQIEDKVKEMAEQGLRVLAFARLLLPSDINDIDHEHIAKGLQFIGLQAMIDPPREEAVKAIAACHAAGIDVKMITGDHAITAAAIAQQIGINHEESSTKVFTGRELEKLSDDALIDAAKQASVFARVTPEQKLRLVEALQANGDVVAMTGDGVNDAPAVRKANIGVAMGITGTEVAKEAADMVLTDDNFATIESAIEEGRGVFDNLTKFLTWILPTNAGQGLVIMAAVILAEPLPVLPVQALWINMTTAVLLGLALAFEPREPGIMQRPPRAPGTAILSGELIFRIILVGLLLLVGSFGLFEWALQQGASEAEARTIAVNVFAVGQSFYLLNCRSLRFSMFKLGVFSNPWIWIGIAAMAVAQLAFTYLPIMNTMFQTAPIGLNDWLHIFAVGFIIYLVVAVEKMIRQRFGQNN